MNRTRNLVEIGEFYASTILNEKKNTFPGPDTFEVQKDIKIKEPTLKKILPKDMSGPDHKGAETLFKAGNKKAKKTGEELSVYDDERFTEENPEYTASKKNTKKKEKIQKESINNFMTKSIFDKLYETVMNEEGLPGHDETEAHDIEALELPAGGEAEGEVTITLDRETAKKLHDVLMAVLGETEEASDEEDSDEDSDEDAETLGEATDLEELPNSHGLEHTKVSKGSNVVKSSWSTHHVDGTEGDGKIKDGIDAEGTPEGHALVNAKKGHPTPVTGKANVVASRATKNVGKVAFTK